MAEIYRISEFSNGLNDAANGNANHLVQDNHPGFKPADTANLEDDFLPKDPNYKPDDLVETTRFLLIGQHELEEGSVGKITGRDGIVYYVTFENDVKAAICYFDLEPSSLSGISP